MIKAEYELLEDLARNNECADHHRPLVVAWYSDNDWHGWTLRCGEGNCQVSNRDSTGTPIMDKRPGHYPDNLVRVMSLTEEHKAGAELPEPVRSNVEKGIQKRAAPPGKEPTAVTFPGVPAVDLGTGELLTREVVQGLVNYARKYGLDPARGHVVLMYGKPYITIDGYLYHAKKENIPFVLASRPLTESERKDYQIGEGDHAWVSEVKLLDTGGSVTGQGIVTRDETTEKSKAKPDQLRSPVVAKHPWQLAQKRGEWQALRRAFPIGESGEDKEDQG